MVCSIISRRQNTIAIWVTLLQLVTVVGLVTSFVPRTQLYRSPSLTFRSDATITAAAATAADTTDISSKDALLMFLSAINDDPNRLPCGIQCTEQEQNVVLDLVAQCVASTENQVVTNGGKIKAKDVLGEWDLLYTSSRTFLINKSLSGLGRSESENARFRSLRQKISGSQYLGFIEFVERLGLDEENGLDIVISGEWMFEPGMDSVSGAPVTAIRAELMSVEYGPSKNQADDWDSLGPVKLLDIIYMDSDLHISRSKIKPDTIFVYKRV